jgi:hypothetical protein
MKGGYARLTVLCALVAFCGVASAEGYGPGSLYLKNLAFDDYVYYARAPNLKSDQQEISECMFRVARQLAIRNKVFVRLSITTEAGTTGKGATKATVVLDFDQNNSLMLKDALTLLKASNTGNGMEALIRFDGKPVYKNAKILERTKMDARGNPEWIMKPPAGKAFYAAVGFTESSESASGFLNSDTDAIGRLAEQVVQPVVSGSTRVYETILKGAYIARRWYNGSEKRYYSLALLPR